MPQRQHIISRWLLDRFARDAPAGRTISVYDKSTRGVRDAAPSTFLAPVDDHSAAIEAALGRMESDAARAAVRLAERADRVGPGMWPLAGPADNLGGDGELRELGAQPVDEMRLFRLGRWLAEPSGADRHALAAFLALMYTRSRKMERFILESRDEVRRAYADAVRAHMPALLGDTLERIDAESEDAAFIGLRTPQWADAFARMPWYVVRAEDETPFVLGDSPVVATAQIGFDADAWRPLMSEGTFAVCMPIGSAACLVAAPANVLPIAVEHPREIPDAINRLSWRWADRHVVARSAHALERVRDTVPADAVDSTIEVSTAAGEAYNRALLEADRHVGAEAEALRRRGVPLRPSLPYR